MVCHLLISNIQVGFGNRKNMIASFRLDTTFYRFRITKTLNHHSIQGLYGHLCKECDRMFDYDPTSFCRFGFKDNQMPMHTTIADMSPAVININENPSVMTVEMVSSMSVRRLGLSIIPTHSINSPTRSSRICSP